MLLQLSDSILFMKLRYDLYEVEEITWNLRNLANIKIRLVIAGLTIRNLKCLDKSPGKYVIVWTQL